MKIISIMVAVCVIIAAGGCQTKDAVNRSAKNGNGTISVNVDEKAKSDSVAVASDEMIVIKEKMFIAQTNDIYFNTLDYLGKTIKYEGIFKRITSDDTDITYYSVIRYGPGCCGVDADAGFEVLWPSKENTYPDENEWVEAVGTLEQYDEDGNSYLRLALTSLKVLDTRGEEYVSQ